MTASVDGIPGTFGAAAGGSPQGATSPPKQLHQALTQRHQALFANRAKLVQEFVQKTLDPNIPELSDATTLQNAITQTLDLNYHVNELILMDAELAVLEEEKLQALNAWKDNRTFVWWATPGRGPEEQAFHDASMALKDKKQNRLKFEQEIQTDAESFRTHIEGNQTLAGRIDMFQNHYASDIFLDAVPTEQILAEAGAPETAGLAENQQETLEDEYQKDFGGDEGVDNAMEAQGQQSSMAIRSLAKLISKVAPGTEDKAGVIMANRAKEGAQLGYSYKGLQAEDAKAESEGREDRRILPLKKNNDGTVSQELGLMSTLLNAYSNNELVLSENLINSVVSLMKGFGVIDANVSDIDAKDIAVQAIAGLIDRVLKFVGGKGLAPMGAADLKAEFAASAADAVSINPEKMNEVADLVSNQRTFFQTVSDMDPNAHITDLSKALTGTEDQEIAFQSAKALIGFMRYVDAGHNESGEIEMDGIPSDLKDYSVGDYVKMVANVGHKIPDDYIEGLGMNRSDAQTSDPALESFAKKFGLSPEQAANYFIAVTVAIDTQQNTNFVPPQPNAGQTPPVSPPGAGSGAKQ
jgi:hypothetical protein